MKKVSIIVGILVVLMAPPIHARDYKTVVFDFDASKACAKLRKELLHQARQNCFGNGGLKETYPGGCTTERKRSGSYKAKGRIAYVCRNDR